jgi:hypothetical protein
MSEVMKRSSNLFNSARALEDTWISIERLVQSIDATLTSSLVGKDRQFSAIKSDESGAEIPTHTLWSQQWGFRLFEGRRTQRHSVLIQYEFRLCWPAEYHIIYSGGTDAQIPLIIVKGTSAEWEPSCYDILTSAEERTGDDAWTYSIVDRLVWNPDESGVSWAFVVPLFSIQSDDDLKRELIQPVQVLASAKPKEDPKSVEAAAFANTQFTLRWHEDAERRILLQS